MQGSIFRYVDTDASGEVILDDGRVLPFTADALVGSGLLGLRIGQRVSLALGDGEPASVERLWIVGIGEGQAIH